MASILANSEDDTLMLDEFDARSSGPAVDLGDKGDNDDERMSAGPSEAEAEEKDQAEIEGLEELVPESIPDYASKALGALYAELVALLPTSSPRIRRGVRMAHDLLKLSSKSKSYRRHVIAISIRCLTFFKRIAIREAKSGAVSAPGTAAYQFLGFVLSKMSEFRKVLAETINMSIVKRSANRNLLHARLQDFVARLYTTMRDAQKDLSLHHCSLLCQPGPPPQALSMPSMNGCLRWVVDDISADIHARTGESRVTLEHIVDLVTLLPFLRDIDADKLPSVAMQSSTFVSSDASTSIGDAVATGGHELNAEGEFDRVGKNATGLEQLEFPSKVQAEQWTEQVCDQLLALTELFSFRTTIQLSTALHGLHHVLIAACKIGDYTRARHIAEIIVTALHDRFLLQPSDLYRFRLVNALAALAFILGKTDCRQDAVRTIKEATRAFLPLSRADTAVYNATMGVIRSEYGRHCLELRHRARSPISDSAMRQARRMTTIAMDLLRGALESDTSDWRSQYFLGRAFHLRSQVFRYRIGGEDRSANDDPDIWAVKAITEVRSAAQIKPRLLEPGLALLLAETVGDLTHDPDEGVPLCKEAVEIYERYTIVWSAESIPALASLHLSLGVMCYEERDYSEAVLALTNSIELDYKAGCERAWELMLRARSNLRLERYRAAFRDVELAGGREGPYELAEVRSIAGFCKWMMCTGREAEALRDLLEGVRLYQSLGYSTHVEPDTGVGEHEYMFALAWLGGVQAVTGSLTSAKKNGKLAVDLIRAEIATMSYEGSWVKIDLARVLVFYAATLLKCGHTNRAKARIDECVDLVKQLPSMEASTKKTVWMLKAHIHDIEGAFAEAEQARTEARMLKCLGFFHRLAT
ncbi:hypothetical protein CF326_g5880 [Tilletia indica]|nr:hypothetical protein CF326_g5880 [Tilletia indica]